MRHSRLVFLAMMLVCGGRPAVAAAADGNRAEASELRIAQRQVRSPIVAQRVEGIERLRDLPGVDAAQGDRASGAGRFRARGPPRRVQDPLGVEG